MTDYDPNAPVLVIAPHLTYPTRDGADIAIERRCGELSRFVSYVDIIGTRTIRRYHGGEIAFTQSFDNEPRGKVAAGLRTIAFLSHYNLELYITPRFSEVARRKLGEPGYGAVIYSYLTSATLGRDLRQSGRKEYVVSHNDDVRYFRDIRTRSHGNLGQYLAAWLSELWDIRHGKAWKDLHYIHCTNRDAKGWEASIGSHEWLLGEIGCDLPNEADDLREPVHSGRPIRLMFVGSLSVAMNGNAVRNFAKRYLPALRRELASGVEVKIVGSNPPESLAMFCRENGMELHPNVDDDELARIFQWADFSLLPFEYSNGTKLKLLGSTARGVPVLMTQAIGGGPGSDHPLCLSADHPARWVSHIQATQATGISRADREALREISAPWSWTSMAERFYRDELYR
jgi:hypothetical protein